MKIAKRILAAIIAVTVVASCWVWLAPEHTPNASAEAAKDHYLFAYFTGTSKEGQTIHLAVSDDGYNYTALRNNEPVIIPSKGVGNVRDPYIWYNEQDNYYYILATDLDFTDGGGDYSNNSQSFIIWRSKDLVNWYDETFIDVSKMAHLIGDTRNMSAVWAPQVLWDGSAYVVYFTLACNATSWFDIVYLKTTDLLDPDSYYEFDYILGNSTGNGVDNGYGVIDADIIHNPGDGKYYLFYKTECNSHEMGSTATGTSLKTIHYYVGDTPTGPFRNPGDNKWSNAGFSIFPNYNVSLEGCNSFFDNQGNLIMYVDEFEHKNAAGEPEAYFHIAKSNGTDFKSWSYPNVSSHNINSLSPRHGSVVKITEDEYNRLLNNSWNISSSSYSEKETLKDHLVARYFTTSNVLENTVVAQPDLSSSTGITMVKDSETGEYYASFDSTNGGWAQGEFANLFRKTGGLNYNDGFTITFKAMLQPNAATNNENNDRIYEIADVYGSRTGTEHYTHFSPGGGGNGSYLGNYNGPIDGGNDWLNDINHANRDDECFHEYIISYATGNVMVYVDGELVISRNRFTGVNLDASWYEALGSLATMRIGKSGWDADPLFKGRIADLCIYDCSMSYYDAKSLEGEFALENGWVGAKNYTGITTKVPTFQNTNADRMNSLPNKNEHFSNILYTSNTVKNYDGNNMSADSAVWHDNGNDLNFALYYPETTILLLDGVKDAIMPVSFGVYCENKNRNNKGFYQIYPTTGAGSTVDLGELEISQNWAGWYNNGDYYNCIVSHADGYIGRNSSTSSWSYITNKANYDCHWGAPLKVNANKIDFGDNYYKKFTLTWQVNGGVSGSHQNDHSANISSDNAIYVINFKPILDLRNSITEADYNAIVNNTALCLELRQKYADAVRDIRTMNPTDYGFDAAPVTATKALGSAISEAVGTYEGVMAEIARENAAGLHGHQTANFEAREATCSQNGLTAGSYCTICGEIVEEQQVLATTAHTFTDVTENGVKYKKCSVCGVKIEYQASGVRYENLFSLNRWIDSSSNNVHAGTISTDSLNGTITIVNQNNTEMYTRGHYDGQNLVSARDFSCDCIPVVGGKTYVVEATSLSSSTSGGEVFIFQYNKDGLVFSAIPTVLGLAPGQTAHNEFTVDKNAAYIELRFDCNDAGKTITYSQIGIYEKENFVRFGATTADARLGFYPGDDKDLCYPNPADGYTFSGWYTKSGVKIDNVYQLNNPTTIVYGKWVEAGYNIVYDSIFSFSSWAKSSCNRLETGIVNNERQITYENIFADASTGSLTITNDADTSTYARTNLFVDPGNIYYMDVNKNTDYIIEYTASSNNNAKANICAYLTGGTTQAYESGNQTSYGLGTQYFKFNSGDNTKLAVRFDNVQNGSTITYSSIAVYEESMASLNKPEYFYDHAQNITNRQYMRYYNTKMGIGDVFEYTPTRPGYTFNTWMAETNPNDNQLGDFDMKNLDDSFVVEQNWHLFSTWTENSYTIVYNANGGSGSISNKTVKYSEDVALATSGFTKSGYILAGWSTIPTATTALYQSGQTTNRLNGDVNGQITLYAIWIEASYTVNYDANGGNGTIASQTVKYAESFTLPSSGFTRDGCTLLGWSINISATTPEYQLGQTVSNLADSGTITLYAVWRFDDLLTEDVVVLDFATPIVISPTDNDELLRGFAYSVVGISADGENYASTLDGEYGTFVLDDSRKITYTPSEVINGTEEIYYHVSVNTNGTNSTFTDTITVAPASNILYEETEFTVSNTTGVEWTPVGEASTAKQNSSDEDDIYGYDSNTSGYNKISNYSNGSALSVTVDADNKRSQNLSFEFEGTGFDLNSACGYNTGVMIVSVKNLSTQKMVKSYIVDTYYSDLNNEGNSRYGDTLYQVPIVNETALPYDNYLIQISASYLPSMSGALSTQALGEESNINAAASIDEDALRAALTEIGMEYILDAEEVNVVWFDEDSVLNGGDGVNTIEEGMLETQAVTELLNIVDSIRVYNPITDGDLYYIDSEKGAQYYNVIDNLVNADGSFTIDKLFSYIIGNDQGEITVENYDSVGPKDELYLSSGTDAVAFSIKDFDSSTSKIMISLKAASTSTADPKVNVKIGDKNFDVTSNTEMYYDITDFVKNGTITIQNMTPGTLLSVGSVKITSTINQVALLSSDLDLATASFMMMASSSTVEPNAPEAPAAPEDTTDPNTSTEHWIVGLIRWIIANLKKLFASANSALVFKKGVR